MIFSKKILFGLFQTFLLEKSKVVRQSEGESTFKIFHYLVAGCSAKLRYRYYTGAETSAVLGLWLF